MRILQPEWVFGVPDVVTMSGHPLVVDDRVVFGTLSGLVIALQADTGCVLWVFEAVNGIETFGGSINGPGPAVADGRVFVNSGYGMWNVWMPSNAFVAFSAQRESRKVVEQKPVARVIAESH